LLLKNRLIFELSETSDQQGKHGNKKSQIFKLQHKQLHFIFQLSLLLKQQGALARTEVQVEVNLPSTLSRPVCLVGFPIGAHDQIFFFSLTTAVLLMWGALSDEKTDL
jgi:hypothetical protein